MSRSIDFQVYRALPPRLVGLPKAHAEAVVRANGGPLGIGREDQTSFLLPAVVMIVLEIDHGIVTSATLDGRRWVLPTKGPSMMGRPPSDPGMSPLQLRRWNQWLQRPDLAVRTAQVEDDPLAHAFLARLSPEALAAARATADRDALTWAYASDRGPHFGSFVGDPGGACCQACAEGRPCEGEAQPLGASDDSCYGCPPGFHMVATPEAVPNRYICIRDGKDAQFIEEPGAQVLSPVKPCDAGCADGPPFALGGEEGSVVASTMSYGWMVPVTLGLAGIALLAGGVYFIGRHERG